MAQHNVGHFYGIIQTVPTITYDNETHQAVNATVYMSVLRSKRRFEFGNEDLDLHYDQIMIYTGLPSMAARLSELRPYDVVVMKASLNTRNVNKMATCPVCGTRFPVNSMRQADGDEFAYTTSMITFVTPIDFDIRATGLTEEEACAMLVEKREMSNEIQLIGNLCSDPVQWEGGRVTAYQLGVNRKFYLEDDSPATASDYPYIRSYGEQASNDFEALREGSLVLVDGFLKMRYFQRNSICPKCGATKTWNNKVLEVIPYAVEYLANYKTAAERDAEKGNEYGDY